MDLSEFIVFVMTRNNRAHQRSPYGPRIQKWPFFLFQTTEFFFTQVKLSFPSYISWVNFFLGSGIKRKVISESLEGEHWCSLLFWVMILTLNSDRSIVQGDPSRMTKKSKTMFKKHAFATDLFFSDLAQVPDVEAPVCPRWSEDGLVVGWPLNLENFVLVTLKGVQLQLEVPQIPQSHRLVGWARRQNELRVGVETATVKGINFIF